MEHKIYSIQRQSFHVLSYSKKTEGLATTSPGWDEMWNEVVCLAPVEIAIKVGLGSGILTKPLFPQQRNLPPAKCPW